MGALGGAGCLLAATVTLGLALACFAVLERRPPPWLRPLPILHGLLGAAAFILVLATGPAAGPGLLAAVMLGLALAGGLTVALARWRHRPPNLLAVTLHAVLGAGGGILLLTLLSTAP